MTRLLVWFRWSDGREELRYERPYPGREAEDLIREVQQLQRHAIEGGWECPYFYTFA